MIILMKEKPKIELLRLYKILYYRTLGSNLMCLIVFRLEILIIY